MTSSVTFARYVCQPIPDHCSLTTVHCPLTTGARCGQLLVLMHSSARRSRSTGRPFTRCSCTISAASSGFTWPYHTASGYTTTVGPCSHWSRHSDLLMRTVFPNPADLASCCSCVCNSLFPSAVHEGRGAPSGRTLWQTKTWCSNTGKIVPPSSSLQASIRRKNFPTIDPRTPPPSARMIA
jgi:hypothetical protein